MNEGAPKPKGRIVLITGTDTGVGKTFVGCGLGSILAERGVRVVAVKPVESGVGPEISPEEDGVRLAEATGQTSPKTALVRLRTPVAPPVAADLEGVQLDFEAWIRDINRIAQSADLVLVEGAGGFLSPLTWKATARLLAVRLGARALLVVGNRLGCVNHTLLTLEALEQGRIPLLGVVLNSIGAEDESVQTNLDTLRQFASIDRLTSIPHTADRRPIRNQLSEVADWMAK